MSRRATYHLSQKDCDRLKQWCQVHSQAEAARIVGCSPNAVTAAKKRGWVAAHKRPLLPRPGDFTLRASEMPIDALCTHYGRDFETVKRWLVGVDRRYRWKLPPQNQLLIPDDFQEVLKAKGPRATAEHYGRAPSTIWRWRSLLGLLPKKKPERVGPGWVDRWAAERRAQSRSINGGLNV